MSEVEGGLSWLVELALSRLEITARSPAARARPADGLLGHNADRPAVGVICLPRTHTYTHIMDVGKPLFSVCVCVPVCAHVT